ncbi:MAG: hypothetical protein HYY97_03100 [Rhodocyclales bacterium]|nr:hypothetical protein [Rhodocyclales bacterium]
MSIELSRDASTGSWSLSIKRHVFVALGLLLVLSGLTTLTGPWWQGVLIALLEKVSVVVNVDYQWQLAIAQILAGLGLLAYKHFVIDPWEAKIKADKLTFLAATVQIEKVRYYLSNLVDDHSYNSSFHSVFLDVSVHFLKPECNFQHPSTVSAYQAFAASAKQLEEFVGTNFFVLQNICSADGDYRYCLTPHLNMDREMIAYDAEKVAEYDRLKVRLHSQTAEVQKLFTKWIENMKVLGHV